jgi:hypothetical protein
MGEIPLKDNIKNFLLDQFETKVAIMLREEYSLKIYTILF